MDIPTEEVLNLKKQGLGNEDIVKSLKDKNYNSQEIGDAISQAGIKENISEEAPSPGQFDVSEPQESFTPELNIQAPVQTPVKSGRELMETIQELTESVVNEKWEDLMGSLGNITLWKEKMQTDVRAVKQEIIRMEERLNNLQTAVVGKVGEFDRHMVDVSSEIKALEKVMEKIIEPLSENIKELNRVTEKLKERTKK